MQITISDEALRPALKAALTELLQERDAAVMALLAEVLEDVALGRALQAGDQHDLVPAADVWQALNQ